MYGGALYGQRVRRGEEKWSIEGLCKDLDEQLSTGLYVAIGEGMPGGRPQDRNKLVDWAQRFDERFTDIFSVQDAIAEKVRSALAIELDAEESPALRPTHPAIDRRQTGRFFLHFQKRENSWTL